MNKAILIGNLTKDPELRYTPNGVAVTTFTVAINRPRRSENQETDFINIVAWQKLADLAAEYLAKGRQCAVEGRIQTRNYDNKEGKRVYVTEVIAENIQFLGGRGGNGQGGQRGEQPERGQDPFGDPFASSGQAINIDFDNLQF
ncbi:single-stranded DNA-binding protein [Brevibacillus sp. HD3.3A]|uniref:single-stranded DNA-binding protein n=1 Tax=Brevibacillus sp. HD3.3A TaxID=2738979 RepID=UPI00156B9868|nr:single-stranded DNA-binding protein [Brevibacillus sp. HD3.3A]UED72113.1 single-stranded DNA-binding protein [Brevibacillus sp. HD3.3A]